MRYYPELPLVYWPVDCAFQPNGQVSFPDTPDRPHRLPQCNLYKCNKCGKKFMTRGAEHLESEQCLCAFCEGPQDPSGEVPVSSTQKRKQECAAYFYALLSLLLFQQSLLLFAALLFPEEGVHFNSIPVNCLSTRSSQIKDATGGTS